MDKLYYPAIMHPEDAGGYSVWLYDISSTKAVKKTLSIPAWLKSMAEAQQLNFSALLKSALVQRLIAVLHD